MIAEENGVWWLGCDVCHDCHDLDAEDRSEAEDEAEEAGWKQIGHNGSAAHICPSCRKRMN